MKPTTEAVLWEVEQLRTSGAVGKCPANRMSGRASTIVSLALVLWPQAPQYYVGSLAALD
jgi:hypothetical protein